MRDPYDSRTEPPQHSTANEMGKRYAPGGAVSDNPNKSSDRQDDGHISSRQYVEQARADRARLTGQAEPASGGKHVHLDFHHPLEDYLGTWWMRRLLRHISKDRRGGKTVFEQIVESYANPDAPLWHRIKYWPLHRFIRKVKGGVSDETFRQRIAGHRSTLRGFVATARSVAEFGLCLPQRFSVPLIVIWNFTNRCNLRCKHCYQDANARHDADELTLEEKLRVVDQLGRAYVPMVSIAGGEPTISKELLPVLTHCRDLGIHTSMATNGTTLTPEFCRKLADAQCKYIEISLDSVEPQKHDAFRGQTGIWERTVQGMRNVVAQDGLRLGIAMCVHQGNYDEVERMIDFAVELGASCFAHFNFIPVGRGLKMTDSDLTPAQRERLLRLLNETMQSGRISVMSTAPQLGRVSLACAPIEGLTSCSHLGGGGGEKARVVAKYLGGCGAGRCYVCIEPDGNITPCVYMPHRVLGNVRNRAFVDIFRRNEFYELLNDRNQRTHHCEVCEFKHYCGGCRARADAYFGHVNAGDPGCIFNDRAWDDLCRANAAQAVQPVHLT